MQEFSHKKNPTVETKLYRRLIMITAAIGVALALGAAVLSRLQVSSFNPLIILLGVVYIEVAIILYGVFVSAVLGRIGRVGLLLAITAKVFWMAGLLFFLWRASQPQQLAALIGLLSFIPATLLVCCLKAARGG